MVTLQYCPTGKPGHQHPDLISNSVTLSSHWANQSLPYPNNAECLTRKRQVSIFKVIGLTRPEFEPRIVRIGLDCFNGSSAVGGGYKQEPGSVVIQLEMPDRCQVGQWWLPRTASNSDGRLAVRVAEVRCAWNGSLFRPTNRTWKHIKQLHKGIKFFSSVLKAGLFYIVCLLLFYALATSVISGWISTCDSENSWWLYSAASWYHDSISYTVTLSWTCPNQFLFDLLMSSIRIGNDRVAGHSLCGRVSTYRSSAADLFAVWAIPFQPVVHNCLIKSCGMYCPVCGKVHIKIHCCLSEIVAYVVTAGFFGRNTSETPYVWCPIANDMTTNVL